jgi:hypothetical protein
VGQSPPESHVVVETASYTYRFTLTDGAVEELTIHLDHETLGIVLGPREALPEWTRLGFHKCPNCPLDEATHARCPAAVGLVDVIDLFRERVSFETVEMSITSPTREYRTRAPLQKGISALMGLIMASSGCPILGKLRPMVETHLPFMTPAEATYRILSMYLLGQFFVARDGREPDWKLERIGEFFADVRQVNQSFAARLREVQIGDANLNALVILSDLSTLTSLAVEADGLERLERIFNAPDKT